MITATVEVRAPLAGARRLYGEILGGRRLDGDVVAFGPSWRLALAEPSDGRMGFGTLTLHAADAAGGPEVAGVAVVDGERDGAPGGDGLVRSLDHACLAVHDVAPALALLRDRLGGAVVVGGDNRRGFRALQVRWPGGLKIELLWPTRPDAPIAAFLDRRGPGLHHLTGLVDDVGAAVTALEAAGIDVVDTDVHHPRWKETYIRPRSAAGALVQLAWTDVAWTEPLPAPAVETILRGGYEIAWNLMEPRA